MNKNTLFGYCQKRDIENLVKSLNAYPELINTRNRSEMTMLHWCIKNKRREIAEALINLGADVNLKDCEGNTPAILAAYAFDFPLIKLLVDNGANVRIRNRRYMDVMDVVVKKGGNDDVQALIDIGVGFTLQSYPRDGISEFSKAIKGSHFGIAYQMAKNNKNKKQMEAVLKKFDRCVMLAPRSRLNEFGKKLPEELVARAMLVSGGKVAEYLNI